MTENIAYYKNIIFYNGIFYTEKSEIKEVNLHNRIKSLFSPSDINLLDNLDDIEEYDKGILLLDGFHSNIAHSFWDFMYPSWYGLHYYMEEERNSDFLWMTLHENYKMYSHGWHLDILETFSGNKITTPVLFSELYKKPLKIPYLIVGCKNIGIGCVKFENLCVSKQFKDHLHDPIESFVNRIYSRYNIQRNTLLNKKYDISSSPINILYINSKRAYNKMNLLFNTLSKKYENKCNFRIINWEHFNFEQQLHILNSTQIIICGVGTARANTPFLPNGSIEIQTNDHNMNLPNNIDYFDYHIGTLSNYVKVFNIEEYTKEEALYKNYSYKLEKLIDESIDLISNNSINFPIKVEYNIPYHVQKLKGKIDIKTFENWRNSLSNTIGDIINLF